MKQAYKILFILIANLVGIESIQAKVACVKGYEWRHGRCRKKVQSQPQIQDIINEQLPMQDIALNSENSSNADLPNIQDNLNINSSQIFNPASQFAGKELIGNYFSNSQTATIFDPSGLNPSRYDFTDVHAISSAGVLRNGTLIGSFETPNWQESAKDMVGYKEKTTELYGTLVTDDQSSDDQSSEQKSSSGVTSHVMPRSAQPHHGAYYIKGSNT